MFGKKVVVFLLTLGLMGSAFASEKTRELSIDGTYMKVTDQPSLSMLNLSLGQLLGPQLAIMTNLMTLDNSNYTSTSIGLGVKYYFMDGMRGDLVPFAGGDIALRQESISGSSSSSTQYDINGGVSYFMTDVTTLDARAKLLTYTQTDGSRATMTVLSVGFTQHF